MNGLAEKPLRHLASLFLAVALVMAGAGMALGASLGFFFAGLALCALLLPWVMAERQPLAAQFLAIVMVTDAIALIWLVMTIADERITLLNWLSAYLLLLSLAGLQWSVVTAGRGLGLRGVLPAASAVLLVMLWLASPAWLLHHLQTPALLPWMQRVINVQPLFAMNSAVPLGVWTESPLAYHMMNLNQDVYYTLPPGSWLSIVSHVGGAALLAGVTILSRRVLYWRCRNSLR